MQRPIVIVESPFAGSTPQERADNLLYLYRCLRDSWDRGELPFASHGFFPLFLNEDKPEERKEGIEAGYEFWKFASHIVFYVDRGMSPGMQRALDRAQVYRIEYTERKIEK